MEIKIIASGSSGNSYFVSDGNTGILLDAGIPFKRIQEGMGFNTSVIDACLVTHRHGDHTKAVPDLLRRGIDVYSCQDVCTKFCGCRKITQLKEFTIGTMMVLPFDCLHDVECFGYLLMSKETGENLLYFTDTSFIKYKFGRLDYVLGEANYDYDLMTCNARVGTIPWKLSKRVIETHMSIDTLLGVLKSNNLSHLKQIYLIHISDNNSNEESFKERIQMATGAEVYVC
jgi:phosphoribosyl 1,2-cyclic phosphodiesterase